MSKFDIFFWIVIGINIGVGICYVCDKLGFDWKKEFIEYRKELNYEQ